MATSLSFRPCPVSPISPFPHLTRPQNHIPTIHFHGLRSSACVARFGLRLPQFPDPGDGSEAGIVELFHRAEGVFYTIADAAVSSSENVASGTKQNSDWLSGITSYMENVLKVLEGGLSALHVPYAYGFAIILLTVLVKGATFPLTKKQVESAMAMRSLQPQIKAIQQRYAGNQEKIQLETARLYKLAGINPLAGCLPTLATIPVWIGLYRALSNVADEGLLTEGFFWIPSLAGPTTVAARQNGSGISWLFPFVDGHPPLGWSDTLKYMVLPLLLIASQYISVQIMQSSQPQSDDPSMKNSQAITKFLPLLIGYFALSVPSGLSLYWLTNNILSTAQQVWLQKLGGANNPMGQLNNDIVTEEQSRLPKSLTELNSTRAEVKQEEKQTQQGPCPGERFKQIKEEEARRRREREEERRRTEVVAAEANKIRDPELVTVGTAEEENGVAVGLGNENEENNQHILSRESSNVVVVNGNFSSQKAKEDQKAASSFNQENNE